MTTQATDSFVVSVDNRVVVVVVEMRQFTVKNKVQELEAGLRAFVGAEGQAFHLNWTIDCADSKQLMLLLFVLTTQLWLWLDVVAGRTILFWLQRPNWDQSSMDATTKATH